MLQYLKYKLVILTLLITANPVLAINEDSKEIKFPTLGAVGNINYQSFYENNPNIVISGDSNYWAAHHNALFSHLIFGNEWADIIVVESNMLGRIINRIDAIDLESMNIDGLTNIPERIKIKGRDLSGELHAIPLTLGVSTLFYRQDVITQKNTSINNVISDWDSFIEFGRELKNDDIKLINNASSIIPVIIESDLNGSNYLYFDNQLKLNIKNERVVKAFELANLIFKEDLSAETGLWNTQWYDSFRAKDATVFSEINGESLIGHLKGWIGGSNSGVWRLSVLPENDAGLFNGFDLIVPSTTALKDEVALLLNFLFDGDSILERFNKMDFFPATQSLYTHADFNKEVEYFGNQRIYQAVIKNAGNLSEFKSTPYDYFIRLKLMQTFEKVIHDEMSIDEALSKVELLTIEYITKTEYQAGEQK
ncbi:MAG: extracellular solute-binding protein [Saccharospirillaceae bacterium]|nr:extracellular solute-binding protein [Pseudomonadales bacterium]NRB78901.1 extracellular solute-binding protein [Saccharospirillaceae bacterium]